VTQTPSLSISSEQHGDRLVLSIAGEFDITCEPLWTQQIQAACDSSPALLALDLAGVTFIDSSGLRLLIVARNAADDAQVPLRLSNIPPPVARVFELTGLLTHFDADDSPDLPGRSVYAPSMTDDSSEQHPEPVVVAAYPDRGEAEVTTAHLAANGIEAFIIDELQGGTLPVEGESGISVMVRAQDADAARQVLGTDQEV
jgi:anti-anti-sigma factor